MTDYIEQAKAFMNPTAIMAYGSKCFVWGEGVCATVVYADTFDEAVISMASTLRQIDEFLEEHKCRSKK
jgi:hypothetical protein